MTAASWRTHTDEALKGAGFRSGGARAAVLDAMAEQSCCVSAQQLHQRVGAEGRAVGIASVYRVLDELVELRLIQRVDVGDGIARFEPAGGDGHHHHHLVCDDCGRVEPFTDERLEQALEGAADRLGYAMDQHEVVLRGACADCR